MFKRKRFFHKGHVPLPSHNGFHGFSCFPFVFWTAKCHDCVMPSALASLGPLSHVVAVGGIVVAIATLLGTLGRDVPAALGLVPNHYLQQGFSGWSSEVNGGAALHPSDLKVGWRHILLVGRGVHSRLDPRKFMENPRGSHSLPIESYFESHKIPQKA